MTVLLYIYTAVLVSFRAYVSGRSCTYTAENYIPRWQLAVHQQLSTSRDMLTQFYVVEQQALWSTLLSIAQWLMPAEMISECLDLLTNMHRVLENMPSSIFQYLKSQTCQF